MPNLRAVTTIQFAFLLVFAIMHIATCGDEVADTIAAARVEETLPEATRLILKKGLSNATLSEICTQSSSKNELLVFAAAASCMKPSRDSLTFLSSYLRDDRPDVRIASISSIARSLDAYSDEDVSSLISSSSWDESSRACICSCLRNVSQIEKYSLDSSPLVRAVSASRVGRLMVVRLIEKAEISKAEDILSRLACDSDYYVRSCSLVAISNLSHLSPSFRIPLQSCCLDPRPIVYLVEPLSDDADKSLSGKYTPSGVVNSRLSSTIITRLLLEKAACDVPAQEYNKYPLVLDKTLSTMSAMMYLEHFDSEARGFVQKVADATSSKNMQVQLSEMLSIRQ